ncbi:MAG: DUF1080 domain-containing protein [Puniceicoccales bacterium]|jgi:hypothetical protein|nr:DUF1080 domain-containing protein [Puniceicoccales bacterium]
MFPSRFLLATFIGAAALAGTVSTATADVCAACAALTAAPTASAAFTPLLDEKLSQWESYLGVPDPSITVPGYTYAKGKPIGLRDPKGVYSVKLENGEPVLHVTGEIFGGLTSKASYGNFHLRFQFRWGEKKWPPRANAKKRDGGFIYHAIGKHGFFLNSWKHSVQLQIQETDVGDFAPLFESRAFKAEVPFLEGRYSSGAPLQTRGGYVAHGGGNFEKPNGEWNSLEVIAFGADVVHVLNGKVVNVLRNLRYVDVKSGDKKEIPLTAGQFQIQSEGAEMDFRRIELRPLTTLPSEYVSVLGK